MSAIMKNFVLNYERQLVDSCDNNGPPNQQKQNQFQSALPNGQIGLICFVEGLGPGPLIKNL